MNEQPGDTAFCAESGVRDHDRAKRSIGFSGRKGRSSLMSPVSGELEVSPERLTPDDPSSEWRNRVGFYASM